MYRVLEFFKTNPRANAADAMKRYEAEFEVEKNLGVLKTEATRACDIKSRMRPLYAERQEVEEEMKMIISEIEMEVFMEYPPRKGSEAQRDAMRNELQGKNVRYVELKGIFRGLTMQIEDLDDQYKSLEIEAKAARRMLETFNAYANFITEFSKSYN